MDKLDFIFFKDTFNKAFDEYLYAIENDMEVTYVLESAILDRAMKELNDNRIMWDFIDAEFFKIMGNLINIVYPYLGLNELKERYKKYKLRRKSDYYKMWILDNFFGLTTDYAFIIMNIFYLGDLQNP